MRTIIIETPVGKFTRQTDRDYKYIVVVIANGKGTVRAWCGRTDLALTAMRKYYHTVNIGTFDAVHVYDLNGNVVYRFD